MSKKPIVIAGAGHGGVQAAVALRQNGCEDPIVLVGDEGELPYHRPPLSKSYLVGKTKRDALWLKPETFYLENNVELFESAAVASIDRRGKRVTLGTGEKLGYSHLILALGARNRSLLLEGAHLRGIHSIRTLADIDGLSTELANARRVVVIGGGLIGLEFAAVASELGKSVVVVEAGSRVMGRVVSPLISEYFTRWHASRGVRFLLRATLKRFTGEGGRVDGVELADQELISADLVVVSVGVRPNTELAARAGLVTGDGIIVDAGLLTSDDDISAIGDCALFPCRRSGSARRIESVQNANDQARSVAARLVGRGGNFNAVPWFWSDQADQKLQIVGLLPEKSTVIVRGESLSGKFSLFHFAGEALVAIESINSPGDHMLGRRLLSDGKRIEPHQVRNASSDLKALL